MYEGRLVALCLLFALFVTCAHADLNSQPRVRAFAALPDWSGIWEAEPFAERTVAGRPEGGIGTVIAKSALNARPPYSTEWDVKYQAGLKVALATAAASNKKCTFGFPVVMETPALFQVIVMPEETLFVFQTGDVRHVHTDGRRHPPEEDLWPTRMGESIGRWEGETLIIDTISRLPAESIGFAAPISTLSEQARFTERVRLVNENELEDELTIDDPVALARPWQLKLKYRRVTDLDRMPSYDCMENDRNPVIDGKLTIAPPRAATGK